MKGSTKLALAIGAAAWLASQAHAHHGHGLLAVLDSVQATPDTSPAASAAIHYARAQIGKPYIWGGTGPGGYDCSGLTMEAYASAGITVERTSEQQYASEPHVSGPVRGGSVFFAGADGTTSAPGHVGLVLGPHKMIEAYAQGYPIRVSTFGLPSSPPGDQNPVGFTDPAGG